MTRASDVLDQARLKGVMIATAESCTGGMVASALTDVPGSSAVVDRGFVTYSNEAKMQMLGVRASTLEDFGAVSEQTAKEMAQGAASHSQAQLTVSITGIAGPGGSDYKPEGLVCFATTTATGTTAQTVEFGALGRANVRAAARDHALDMLKQALDTL